MLAGESQFPAIGPPGEIDRRMFRVGIGPQHPVVGSVGRDHVDIACRALHVGDGSRTSADADWPVRFGLTCINVSVLGAGMTEIFGLRAQGREAEQHGERAEDG